MLCYIDCVPNYKIDSMSFEVDNMDLDEVSSFKYLGIKVKNDHRSKFSNLSNWKEEA